MPNRDMENFRKRATSILKQFGLKITTEFNLQQTDFFDGTLNLKNGKYWPYEKPNNELLHVNAQSNHPASILKQIPRTIKSKIAKIS